MATVADRALCRSAFRRVQARPTSSILRPPTRIPRTGSRTRAPTSTARSTSFEAARAAGVARFVNFHTALGYGRPDTIPIPVDAPARPSRATASRNRPAKTISRCPACRSCRCRLANVTGPRLAIGPIPTFYTRLKAGKGCFCSKTVRDFIDMDDFFALMDLVLADGAPIGIYNVSTGTGHTIKEIFDIVVDHLGMTLAEPVPEVGPRRRRCAGRRARSREDRRGLRLAAALRFRRDHPRACSLGTTPMA